MKNHWLGLVIFSFATLIINVLLCQGQQSSQRLVFDQAETAGISGLRPFWDRPVVLAEDGAKAAMDRGNILKGNAAIWARELEWHRGYSHWMDVIDPKYQPKPADPAPGAIAFDAVHRSLLVRFPGCAEGVAEALKKGGRIARAELVLPFRETERLTAGYEEPSSFIGNMWDRLEPRWHAVAWRLRRAWKADPATGPTFNDAVKGRISWTRYGAQTMNTTDFPPNSVLPRFRRRKSNLWTSPLLSSTRHTAERSANVCGESRSADSLSGNLNTMTCILKHRVTNGQP